MNGTGMSRRGFLRASAAAAAGLAVSGCKSTKEASLEEKNKAISRRLIEDGWGPGDLSVFDEVISPDFTGYGLQGLEAYKQMCAAGPFTALSERQYTIHSQIAKGDQVGTHFTLRAIQTGPLNGIPTRKSSLMGCLFTALWMARSSPNSSSRICSPS
jgi:predicted ester cyclase